VRGGEAGGVTGLEILTELMHGGPARRGPLLTVQDVDLVCDALDTARFVFDDAYEGPLLDADRDEADVETRRALVAKIDDLRPRLDEWMRRVAGTGDPELFDQDAP
jgi:hypothetical protein